MYVDELLVIIAEASNIGCKDRLMAVLSLYHHHQVELDRQVKLIHSGYLLLLFCACNLEFMISKR